MTAKKSLHEHLNSIKNLVIKEKFTDALHRIAKVERKFKGKNNKKTCSKILESFREYVKKVRYIKRFKKSQFSFFRECPKQVRKSIFVIAKNMRKKGYSFKEIDNYVLKNFKIKFSSQGWKFIRNVKMSSSGLKRYKKKIHNDKIKAASISGKIKKSSGFLEKIRKDAWKAWKIKARKRIPKSSRRMSVEKVRTIGHCLFDGGISLTKKGYTAIFYTNKSDTLINQFKNDMKSVYKLEPTDIRSRKSGKMIRYCCIAVVEDILRYISNSRKFKEKIPNDILFGPRKYKIELIKTFWDDEGAIIYNDSIDRYGRRHVSRALEAFCDTDLIRKQLIKLHKDIGIETKTRDKKIIISKIENLRKFKKLLNFSLGVKVSYSKSKWDGMEKSNVLQIALSTARHQNG